MSFFIPSPDDWDPRTRIDLIFNLRDAAQYHRDRLVPGIGGLAFVRQASWAVEGIAMAKLGLKRKNGDKITATDMANAIEALGSKIEFIYNCKKDKDRYGFRGSRAFGRDKTNEYYSFNKLSNKSYYVQNTYRQAVVTALTSLKLCKDSPRFNQMSLDNAGEDLRIAFESTNPSKCTMENFLKDWVKEEDKYKPFSSWSFWNAFSPKKPSKEEQDVIKKCLYTKVDSMIGGEYDRRINLIDIMTYLSEEASEDELKEKIRMHYKGSADMYINEIDDAIRFSKIRNAAVVLLLACCKDVNENGRNSRLVKDCAAEEEVIEGYINLQNSCKDYRSKIWQSPNLPKSSLNFAEKICSLDVEGGLSFLVQQEHGIIDVYDGKFRSLNLFDKFLERTKNVTNDMRDNIVDRDLFDESENVQMPRSKWTLSRLDQWHNLWKDSFGG